VELRRGSVGGVYEAGAVWGVRGDAVRPAGEGWDASGVACGHVKSDAEVDKDLHE